MVLSERITFREPNVMKSGTVGVAVDHGGFPLKKFVIDEMQQLGLEVSDLGTDREDSVDYPDFADKLVAAIAGGRVAQGVLICGTGIGISIAANRHPSIRAALCYDEETAVLARQHNDANVLCLGGRKTDEETARKMVRAFFGTKSEGGRHARRVAKMS